MAFTAPKVIFGTAGAAGWGKETTDSLLGVLKKHNVKVLDTAWLYGGSEPVLKEHGAPKDFEINTKAPGFGLGRMSKQSILDGMQRSLDYLGVDSVELYYFHSPDPTTPIAESLSAIQELYAAGKFRRFGLSNFLPEAVQEVYNIQKAANSVLPSVFQGNYSAVSRHIEENLFPLLRKLNIKFYAYSPIAGGFLVKDSASIRSADLEGRFNNKTSSGEMYSSIYAKDSLLDALDEWGEIAKDAGITKAALAYRWISYHSALNAKLGDSVIIGARKTQQLEETLAAIEAGPLDQAIAERASAIWAKVKDEAPLDNWNSYSSLKQ